MPLQNRVLPTGDIVAAPMRGTLMGNRGCLHDDKRRILRPWASKAWIICLLQFKGRKQVLMRPGHYTQLFFLDEASALAAGHRPCAKCQPDAFRRFRAAWARGNGAAQKMPRAAEMDAVLHDERVEPGWRAKGKRVYSAELGRLPDGAMVVGPDGGPHLWLGCSLRRWTPGGYAEPIAADPSTAVNVLTPRSTVSALGNGYVPVFHESAELARV